MTKGNNLIGFYYFYFLFVIASGMFESPLRELFLYSTPIFLFSLIFQNQFNKSKFLMTLLIIVFFVFLFYLLIGNNNQLSSDITTFQREKNDYIADSIYIANLKMMVKVILIFIVFPIEEKYFLNISYYIKIFIYIVFIQVFISTLLFNFFNLDIETVKDLFPLLSNFKPDLEQYPFVFLSEVIPGIESIKYVRPMSIFGEPTALGSFIMSLLIINSIIEKKINTKILVIALLIFIIAVTKFALVVTGITLIIYYISKFVRNKFLVFLISLAFIILWWQILLILGTGYMQVRTTDTILMLNHLTMMPNGFNATSWYMGINYGLMGNLGAISIIYDLGIILALFVYANFLIIFIKVIKISHNKTYSLYFAIFVYFIFSFLLNNVYYSGIFLLTIYIYYINLVQLNKNTKRNKL